MENVITSHFSFSILPLQTFPYSVTQALSYSYFTTFMPTTKTIEYHIFFILSNNNHCNTSWKLPLVQDSHFQIHHCPNTQQDRDRACKHAVQNPPAREAITLPLHTYFEVQQPLHNR